MLGKQVKHRVWLLALAVLAFVLVTLACGKTVSPKPYPTFTPYPTYTPYPTITPEPTATLRPIPTFGDTWTRPADGMVMVYVPGGTFQMGSDESDTYAYEDEFPRHSVTLDGFWIDQTEVTNAQYGQCVEAGACLEPTWCHWGEPTYGDASKQDHPVVCVSWHWAEAYCGWVGARLPTEAEWEYAARGRQGFIYPWGDDFECWRGNFYDATEIDESMVPGGEGCDGYERTAPVGSFPSGASWCNAMDMAGNVWEWVFDAMGDYPSEAQTNPFGPIRFPKVMRGGGWDVNQEFVRAAARYGTIPGAQRHNVGYRCVIPGSWTSVGESRGGVLPLAALLTCGAAAWGWVRRRGCCYTPTDDVSGAWWRLRQRGWRRGS